ncbi:FHA domain-containing protein [Herbiconiux ginsengi]|uniref:FHA domain-containing protein n=1 Tax=Herbiconiux ginsengi TaxID=381665 RepID=A0A1H3QHH3_9MICO|nr:FHA domain-containing protein [Herbiconiux ginsengi]SDZ12581.1 FHA domain-containing protein [Herbiconiux ginsengi]
MKCRTCGTTLTAGALLCGECGTSAIAPRPTLGDTERHDRRALLEAIAREAPARAGVPSHTGAHARPLVDDDDVDDVDGVSPLPAEPGTPAEADVARGGPLFSLVFSTGESVRVSGSGLVGRNPAPREGETFDYLVQIVDPERSVSKTHFEFGVDGDRLWIADRGSANGTRLGLDLVDPIDLVPGERMRVPRGTRIGIGDQYLDVH